MSLEGESRIPKDAEWPSDETIMSWLMDEENPEATDGCEVEPDGTCPHGYPSWLIVMGMI